MTRIVFRTPESICIGDIVAGHSLKFGRNMGQAAGIWAPTTPWALVESGLVHVGYKDFYVGDEAKARIEATDASRRRALFLVREVLLPGPEVPCVWVRVARLRRDSADTRDELGSEELWF